MLMNFLHSRVVLAEPLAQAMAAGEQRLSMDAAILAKAMDLLGDFAVNLAIAAIIFVLTLLAARWASGAARKILGRTRLVRRDPTVLAFMVQIVRVVVVIIGMIAVLQRLGVQTTSIIAVLGAASLAVGLALQGTLSNVAAGVMLLILRPYRVGEAIDVGGASGTVQKLDLFTTQLTNANNHKIVIPNSKVLSDVIVNVTGQRTRRIEIKFTVGYGENLKDACAVLASVAKVNDRVLKDPAPWTGVTGLLDSAVQITLHAWVNNADWWQTQSDLMQAGKEALDEAGIEIPFPHQVEVPAKDAKFARVVMAPLENDAAQDGSSGRGGE
ncbi:mechanosensitive ion channel family protein [Brevundimonas naejangsanensis]|uniref:mechanosensitive ion channel family protein n=1 Tax=Brevundimonas naejangsanensis TaxID=588932 RepID=UPI00106D6FBE|nr:mechanosensitive ion channel family protein [Brevundimonas naejangsanensis]QBQ48164.1 mechanosensitive ion channel family protein [Brevundimonas naejangsanensis]